MLLIPINPDNPFELLISLITPDSGTLRVRGRSAPADGVFTQWPAITVLHSEPERRELELRGVGSLEIELELAVRGAPGTYVEITLQINQEGRRVWEQTITGMTDGEGDYRDQRSLRAGDEKQAEQRPPARPESEEQDHQATVKGVGA